MKATMNATMNAAGTLQDRKTPGVDVTRLLVDWRSGDERALEELMPLVVNDLRLLARGCFASERREHTLQPTALVNEVYMRLVDARRVQWRNRAHFFGIAGRLMRQVLVDHARSHRAQKRGGGMVHSTIDLDLLPERRAVDLLALDDALETFAGMDPVGSQVVEMRYFAGLTQEEIAEVLGVSLATVKRKWSSARAWLYRELRH